MNQFNISDDYDEQKTFDEPTIVPYAGISGKWIPSQSFTSNGSTFGYYKCNYCTKNWMSAHSKKKFKQGCKGCNRYFYATHLWENSEKNWKNN